MLKRVSVNAYSASNSYKVECSKYPKMGMGGVSYLRRLVFFGDYTDIDVGAGGAVSPIELHDLLGNVQQMTGGETWGPQNLSGHELAYLFASLSGPMQLAENVDANGDENIPASTSNAVRQVVETFAWDLIGAESADFCPPTGYLAELGGVLEVNFSALPTNATGVVGNVTTYVDTVEVPELRAVPAVRALMTGVNALTGGSLPGGRLHFLGIKRSSDITDSLIDLWKLSADGQNITDMGDPSILQQFAGLVGNAGAVGDNLQESGADSLGGTRPRYLQLYPHHRYDHDRRITKRVSANQFTYDITSGLTASQFEFLMLLSTRLTAAAAIDQAAPCGVCGKAELVDMVKRDAAGAAKPKTSKKVPGIADRFQGWVPIKFRVPPSKFGLRGT